MATIEVKLLFTLEMKIEGSNQVIGAIPQGARSIGYVNGTFSGPGIRGTIRACDWFLTRADGIGEADVRGILKTDDGALIYMNYQGWWICAEWAERPRKRVFARSAPRLDSRPARRSISSSIECRRLESVKSRSLPAKSNMAFTPFEARPLLVRSMPNNRMS